MQNHKKYLVAIIFLTLGIAIIIGIFYWFNIYSSKDYKSYKIIFTESVDGLSTHAPVRYNGVMVGYVDKIDLSPTNPNNIDVVVCIEKSLTILTSTRASLKSQGITGLYYVGLSNIATKTEAQILTSSDNSLPTITSIKSFSNTIMEHGQQIGENLSIISERATEALNQENLNNLSIILSNMSVLSKQLLANSNDLSYSLQQFNQVATALQINSNRANQTMDSIKILADNMLTTNNNINNLLLPNFNHLTVNLNKNMIDLNKMINTINNHPDSLLKGLPKQRYGPGEK